MGFLVPNLPVRIRLARVCSSETISPSRDCSDALVQLLIDEGVDIVIGRGSPVIFVPSASSALDATVSARARGHTRARTQRTAGARGTRVLGRALCMSSLVMQRVRRWPRWKLGAAATATSSRRPTSAEEAVVVIVVVLGMIRAPCLGGPSPGCAVCFVVSALRPPAWQASCAARGVVSAHRPPAWQAGCRSRRTDDKEAIIIGGGAYCPRHALVRLQAARRCRCLLGLLRSREMRDDLRLPLIVPARLRGPVPHVRLEGVVGTRCCCAAACRARARPQRRLLPEIPSVQNTGQGQPAPTAHGEATRAVARARGAVRREQRGVPAPGGVDQLASVLHQPRSAGTSGPAAAGPGSSRGGGA